jgi:bifunctional non-homologous end joining protein LigD
MESHSFLAPAQRAPTFSGRPTAMPSTWRPQLAAQAASPPTGGDWLHEIKYDGYRTIAFIEDGAVRFLTRNGCDWTARYGDLGKAFESLPCQTAIIDGEVAVPDATGVTTLGNLQRALLEQRTETLTYFAFDLCHLDGRDLRGLPLVERKAALERLIAPLSHPTSQLLCSGHDEPDGAALLEFTRAFGMEGIVSKRADSPYVHRRSPTWLKIKNAERGRFVVIGFLSNTAGKVSSLILAEECDGKLRYSCRAGAGLTAQNGRELHAVLGGIEQTEPATPAPPTRGAHWVDPRWTVEIGFHLRTAQGRLRSPVLLRGVNRTRSRGGASSAGSILNRRQRALALS